MDRASSTEEEGQETCSQEGLDSQLLFTGKVFVRTFILIVTVRNLVKFPLLSFSLFFSRPFVKFPLIEE